MRFLVHIAKGSFYSEKKLYNLQAAWYKCKVEINLILQPDDRNRVKSEQLDWSCFQVSSMLKLAVLLQSNHYMKKLLKKLLH